MCAASPRPRAALIGGALAVVSTVAIAVHLRAHGPGREFKLHNLTHAGISDESLRLAVDAISGKRREEFCHDAKTVPFDQTYGEITREGMEALLRNMPSQCALTPQSVFLDIGSGEGRLPYFVRLSSSIKEAVGIELVRCRHERARELRRAYQRAANGRGGLTYVLGDVRKAGLHNATHIFMHSTCFGGDLVRDILRLANEAGVECIINYGRIYPFADGMNALSDETVEGQLAAWGPIVHVIHAPASWMKSMRASVHRRRGLPGSDPLHISSEVLKVRRNGGWNGA